MKSISATSTSDIERTPRVSILLRGFGVHAAATSPSRARQCVSRRRIRIHRASFVAPGSALAGVELTFDASPLSRSRRAIASFAFIRRRESRCLPERPPREHTYASKGTSNITLTVTASRSGGLFHRTDHHTCRRPVGVNISKSPTLHKVNRSSRTDLASCTSPGTNSIQHRLLPLHGRRRTFAPAIRDPIRTVHLEVRTDSTPASVRNDCGAGRRCPYRLTIFDVFYGLAEVFHFDRAMAEQHSPISIDLLETTA